MQTGTVDLSVKEKELLAQISWERLMDFNANVAKEVRLSGSEEELRAFQYVKFQLDSFGFRTKLSFSDAYISLPGQASLSVNGVPYACITHSMAVSVSGLEAPLVYMGKGEFETATDIEGKVLLVDGLAVPGVVKAASELGAAGLVFINAEYTHEMIISPVWGHPTPETIHLMPNIPAVSVTKQVGEQIKHQLRELSVLCSLTAHVESRFRSIPTLIAELDGNDTPEDFVLFSGHIDSWHYGAMDNGSANALMLEVGRILSDHRGQLKRSLRLAFWSGHSHGRYAGSSQYCDANWEELHEHCVLHVNVDSVGGKGSTILTEANCMAETKHVAADVIKELIGDEFHGTRYGRSGDQSFWGTGIPSLFMGLSEQAPADNPAAAAFGELFGGGKTGGFGWWWHTTEDTLDKVDADCLVRDTQVYVSVLYRVLAESILPIEQHAAAQEIHDALVAWQEKASQHFDLSVAIERAKKLTEMLETFNHSLPLITTQTIDIQLVNHGIKRLSRLLVPLNYVKGNVFEHDLALSQPPIPKLLEITKLVQREPDSEEYRLFKTSLVRKYNEVAYTLKQAIQVADQLLQAVQNAAQH